CNGDADLQRPLLGVGQHAGRTVPARSHADALDDLVRPPAHFLERANAVPERVLVPERPEHRTAQVLVHRKAREYVRDLEAARQSLAVDQVRLKPSDVLAVQVDPTRTELKTAADQIEERGFA